MSKIRVRSPIVHTPAFEEFTIGGQEMQAKILAAPLELPMGMMDSHYYYTDIDGWAKLIEHLLLKSSLYRTERFDWRRLCHKGCGDLQLDQTADLS